MAARGLIVGVGRIVNVKTNTFFGVQAGFTMSFSYTNQQVEAGATLGQINITAGQEVTGQFGFRESSPEIWADLMGGTVATGAAQNIYRTKEEQVAAATNQLTLAENVEIFDTGEVGLQVTPIGSAPLTVIDTGSVASGQVKYVAGTNTLELFAGEFSDGALFDVSYTTHSTDATRKVWSPSPSVIPQPLKLWVALQLHEPFLDVDIGGGVGILLKSVTLDGEVGPIGAGVADVGNFGVNFRVKNAQSSDVQVYYNDSE